MKPHSAVVPSLLRRPVRMPGAVARPLLSPTSILAAFWLAILIASLAMAIWAAQADHFPADVAVGRWIQEHDVPGQDVRDFVRDVGSSVAGVVTVALAAATLFLSRRRLLAFGSLFVFGGFALGWVLKKIVARPRTSIDYLVQKGTFDSLSFPSGHVMSSTLAGGLLLYLCWRVSAPLWIRLPIALWALGVLLLSPWVAVSGGVHWPSDVLGGLVWGLVVLLPVLWLLERLRPEKRHLRWR